MRTKWTFEKLKEEALKYDSFEDFIKNSKGAYLAAWRRGVLYQITVHMNKSLRKPWGYEELRLEALKYKTRWEFQQKNKGAYLSAYRKGILNEICVHMEYGNYPWTEEELEIEAKKYKSRWEFQLKNSGAYESAYNRGILDKICSHMGRSRNVSNPENELLEILKLIYPKAKSMKDTKVKIEGKSHIKGFDIDIFIPELNKGIEFDGEYWHSDRGLRRSRSHWPQEDIDNYHELKDTWFASRGIRIFHIKGEEWDKNEDVCIQKCLEFLK